MAGVMLLYLIHYPCAKVQFLYIKYLIFIALLHIMSQNDINQLFVIKIIYKHPFIRGAQK
jgi:hypothetical protein